MRCNGRVGPWFGRAAAYRRRCGGGPFTATAAAGFTMFEAMLAVTIIGVAFLGMLNLIAVDTRNNREATELTVGMNLARDVRESMVTQRYADQLAMNGVKYSPPRDSTGATLGGFADWEQAVTVQPVNPTDVATVTADTSPNAVRVTTAVRHNGRDVYQASWCVFRR